METTIAYHVDGYGPARPAINVKSHSAGLDFWPTVLRSDVAPDGMMGEYEPLVNEAYERVVSDFWQAAEEIATQRGLGEITQEGRSGGWLVFTDPRLVGLLEDAPNGRRREAREWLADYRAMTEWADAYITAAPAKVAALAQQLAMDAAGQSAAQRMFGRV